MRTNIQALAVDYALKDVKFNGNHGEDYDNCKKDFEEGFKVCLELVKPILQSRISKDLLGKENEDIKEFLEQYQ